MSPYMAVDSLCGLVVIEELVWSALCCVCGSWHHYVIT